jgi:cellobiose phosphorylase
LAFGDNACGCLHGDFDLEPGQTIEFLVIIGIGNAAREGKTVLSQYTDTARAGQELNELKTFWQDRIDGLTVSTPDSKFNRTVNIWGIYNSLITFTWSRAASLIYTGVDRDGLGFRDTVQDFLGVTHTIPQEVNDRLSLMLTGQVSTGGTLPVVYPTCHSPGNEPLPSKHDYRSDDALWLFNAIPAYIKETGHVDYLHTLLPYADREKDTVFGHMKRAIQFSLARRGVHGLPLGLKADWNDCLRFGHAGESVFVAMQLRLAIATYIEIAQLLSEEKEQQWGEILLAEMDRLIHEHAWDGEWFLRGFGENDRKFGSKENHEGQIFLNPQVWAVMSGVANRDQGEQVMQHVHERLFTPFGLMLCDPPFTRDDHTIVLAQLMNPGLKENAGIFMHTQGWAVIAEAMLGHGNRAYEILQSYLPAAFNDRAEIREIEPYVLCQSAHSKHSPKQGACRIPWLSGSATWTHYAMTQYILGIRPDYDGLIIDPCLPSHWKTLAVKRHFRGKTFNITLQNDSGKESGASCMQVNGQEMTCNKIPVEMMDCQNEVIVVM